MNREFLSQDEVDALLRGVSGETMKEGCRMVPSTSREQVARAEPVHPRTDDSPRPRAEAEVTG